MEVPKIPSFALSFEKNVFLNQKKKFEKKLLLKLCSFHLLVVLNQNNNFIFIFK